MLYFTTGRPLSTIMIVIGHKIAQIDDISRDNTIIIYIATYNDKAVFGNFKFIMIFFVYIQPINI